MPPRFTIGGVPVPEPPPPESDRVGEIEGVSRKEITTLKLAAEAMLDDKEKLQRYASLQLLVGWQIDNLLGNEPWRVKDDVALAAKCRDRAEKVGVKILELLGGTPDEDSRAGTSSAEASVARLARPPKVDDGDED